MQLLCDLNTLQWAADYTGVRKVVRRHGGVCILAGVLVALAAVGRPSPMTSSRGSGFDLPTEAAFLGLPFVAGGLLLAAWPRPWGFLVASAARFAGAVVLLPTGIIVLAGYVTSEAGPPGHVGWVLVFLASLLFLLPGRWLFSAGLRRWRMFQRLRGTRMVHPGDLAVKELERIKRRILTADVPAEPNIVPILSDVYAGNSARALLEGDVMAVVIGDGWHVLLAKWEDVRLEPFDPSRVEEQRDWWLVVPRARARVRLEPPAVERFRTWLSRRPDPEDEARE